jgi:TRAP-type C4-dicarboxylate transport system permease small subunit
MILERNRPVFEARRPSAGRLLGLRVGEFGPFAICILAWGLGLMAFCVSCFVAILSLLTYNVLGHHSADFAMSYRYVALPVGSTVTVITFFLLATQWVRRKFSAA